MSNRTQPKILTIGLLMVASLIAPAGLARGDYSISNNLTGASGGVESAVGDTYLSAGFNSGTTGGTLGSVTLDLGNSVSGLVEVDIYSDGGLQPGTKVGALSLSGTYSATPVATTFVASGITLSANSTYYVVLKALSGQFDWSWTTDDGLGDGYTGTWGESDDAGLTWFTYDVYPFQMNVSLTSAASVPEPSTWILWVSAAVGVATFRRLLPSVDRRMSGSSAAGSIGDRLDASQL